MTGPRGIRPLSVLREWLRALLFRRREDAELDDELRFHVERQTEENLRRGMEPREARRQALLKLGGVEQTKERVRSARGTRTLEALARDVRHALRRLRREPGFTAPAVVTLFIGDGARMSLIGLSIGSVLALGFGRLLGSMVSGIRAADPATYIGVGVVLAAVTLAASWLSARRAARVDPMIVLKAE